MRRGCETGSLHVLIGPVVVEPIFTRLETREDGMAGGAHVRRSVLRRRLIAAADMAARCAPSQVEPPPTDTLAVLAPTSARSHVRIDQVGGISLFCAKSLRRAINKRVAALFPDDRSHV